MHTLYTRAKNIRSVANATFTPAEGTSLTAVAGANGAGKTTMVTAIPLLAGWGQTPPGVGSLADVIRDGEKTATAEWSFAIGDDVYVVTRTLRRSNTKNGPSASTSKVTVTVNGSREHTLGMKTSEVNAFVTEVTGLSPDRFLATTLIAQDDVDALMSATPATVERGLRDVLGLKKVAALGEKLREEVRAAELPDAPDDDTVAGLRDDARDAETRLSTAQRAEKDAKEALARAVEEYNAAEADHARITRATSAHDEAARNKDMLTSHADDLAARADQAKNALADACTSADVSVPENANAARETAADTAERAASARRLWQEWTRNGVEGGDPAALSARVESTKKALSDLDEKDKEYTAAAEAERAERVERATAARNAADAYHRENAARYAELERSASMARSTMSTLTTTRDALANGAACPTCGSTVDNAAGLLDRLNAEIEAARTTAGATEHEMAELNAVHADLTRKSEEAAAEVNAETQWDTRIEDVRTTRANTQAELDALVSETAAYARSESLRVQLDEAGVTSAEDVETLAGLSLTWRTIADAYETYESASASARQARARADAAEVPAAIDPQEVADAQTRLDNANATGLDARDDAGNATTTRELAQSAHDTAAQRYADALAKVEARRAAERKVSSKDAASRLVKSFVSAYTAERLSIITEAVNSLLPLMDSEMSEFDLGEDYTPTVNVGGQRRETSALSGGERAMVGLLFRVGITAAMRGGALTDTLIADEPMAALDETARERVARLLAELPCPVTVISHTPEAADTADKVVTVTRSRGGVTSLS